MAPLTASLVSDVGKPHTPWKSLLFASHAVASWGQRMWEFAAGLLMLQIGGGESLLLVAVLGFCMFITNFLFSSRVGSCVDATSVISTPIVSSGIMSGSIACAALSAWKGSSLVSSGSEALTAVHLATVAVIAFTCVGKLGFIARSLALEKRWPKALAEGEDLAKLNGRLRRIDLTCKMMAPVAAGLVMNYASLAASGLAVAAFNVIVCPVEILCLTTIYKDEWCKAKLHENHRTTPSTQKPEEKTTNTSDPQDKRLALAAEGQNVRLYFAQANLWQSMLALSMLHCTVLSFGNIMVAYVMTLGVPPAAIAGYRSLGEVFGFTATIVAPRIYSSLGAVKSATLFIWLQWLCLIPCVWGGSNMARSWPPAVSSALLFGGVGVSRLGLWGFDLAVTQLMQERTVPASALAAVSGVQLSLENFWGLVAAVASMVFTSPTQFECLAVGSFASVTVAALLHTVLSKH